jgi:predicted RNA polymerase sigma factor
MKIAQTMRTIDIIQDELIATFGGRHAFSGVEPLIRECVAAAKVKCETLHTDPEIFEVWAALVVAAEKLCAFEVRSSKTSSLDEQVKVRHGVQLIAMGKDLIFHMTRARVPMPKSTRDYVERLQKYRERVAQVPRSQVGPNQSSRSWRT